MRINQGTGIRDRQIHGWETAWYYEEKTLMYAARHGTVLRPPYAQTLIKKLRPFK